MQKARSSEGSDTISSAEEIPVASSVAITEHIYTDGGLYYVSEDKTTDDMLFIENINVHNQPENEKIAKTVIKDNVAYLYNSSGELLNTEQLGAMNLKPMLDSLQAYLATQTTSTPSAAPQAMRVKANAAIKKAQANGMQLVSQSSSEVVMEVDMGSSKSSVVSRVKSSVSKKAIMRFSPDMSRMYSQKIYEGGQLTQSVEMEFATKDESQFSNAATNLGSSIIPDANIKFIKRKSLMTKRDGTPFIMNNLETYKKNQVNYKFNKK